jgi:hypothetical protein
MGLSLPILQTEDSKTNMMQTKWASIINPFLMNPTNSKNVLMGISLNNGVTVINHLLGRMMQGWTLTDINGSASIYRSAPMNNTTLTITSNAAVVVNIEVF